MKIGIVFAYTDNRREGRKYNGAVQPVTGALIAALLPPNVDVEVINENSPHQLDWSRDYDLLFISSIHSDFDRARQISHYWRRRGARTVYGGFMASTYPMLCAPYFDAIAVGDAEGCVEEIFRDFRNDELKPIYLSKPYDPSRVPVPRFDLLAHSNLLPLTTEVTRGCPFACDFCELTAVGTRYHVRPVEAVVHELREGQRMLRDLVPGYKRRVASFVDNNIGGNLRYLAELCDALAELDIAWGSQITFNCVANEDVVRKLSRAGCGAMFVGLETFNPASLENMNKHQNLLESTKRMLDTCRRHGIVIGSGMMLSSVGDDLEYMERLPGYLEECGLYIPAYICFETPIPGTPYFNRLAVRDEPPFLPNALLRDFSGYTMVVRPARETPEEFIEGYLQLLTRVYSPRTRLTRLARNLAGFLAEEAWFAAASELFTAACMGDRPQPKRTYLAGTDAVHPEATNVPFADSDFDSEEHRQAILEPLQVTDAEGRVLPQWIDSTAVYEHKGAISEGMKQLMKSAAGRR